MRQVFSIALLIAASPAMAQPVLVRIGTHETFGRVVFEFTQSQAFTTERSGNALILRFPGGGSVPDGIGAARNIAAVTGGDGMATLTIPPAARLRAVQIDNRVVVDVYDAARPRPAPRPDLKRPTPVQAAMPPAAVVSSPNVPASAPSPPATSVGPATTPQPPSVVSLAAGAASTVPAETSLRSPTSPDTRGTSEAPPSLAALAGVQVATLATAATHTVSSHGSRQGVTLPFDAGVAAAAFRHGEEAWVVFDDRRPIDVGALASDPLFAKLSIELLPAATLLRIKLPDTQRLLLGQDAEGWTVTATGGRELLPVTMPVLRQPRLVLPVTTPGQVVAVPDPDTGRNLLVGTVRGAGPGVPVNLRLPEFGIRTSWQGVVVDPVSDRTTLRAIPEGFALETGGDLSFGPVADPGVGSGAALANAAVLTRRFEFRDEPVASLIRRLQAQVQEEGEAAPQARLAARKAAAQTMLALGLGPEAQSLLRLAVTEDPRAGDDPDVNGLSGIAALLSGRPQEATGLASPALSGSDEITLWRAIATALADPASPQAAQSLATTANLLLAYPAALRKRLLPLVAEAMVAGGAPEAADALIAISPEDSSLAFAHAARLEQKGDVGAALPLFDALSAGRDRLLSARATTHAILLRLATAAITPAQALDTLESSFSDWRGDGTERELRLRTVDVAAQAGRWREAFAILKDTTQLFPQDASLISARLTALTSKLLRQGGVSDMKPLEFVALAEENAGAIAQTDQTGMALLLADKLTALDLPHRADPIIEKMASAASGAERAALGLRLAALRLAEGDAAGAGAALAITDAVDLPAQLHEERGLIDAHVHAAAHDTAGATAILSGLGTAAADELRATILGDGGDWHGAAVALADTGAILLPQEGPLSPEQQDFVLRLASAQSRAHDNAALHDLALKQADRMTGAKRDMFKLLTAPPVTTVADLGQVAGEIATVRALPTALAAVGSSNSRP